MGRGGAAVGSSGSGAVRSPRRVNPHAVTDEEGRPIAVLVDELNSAGFADEMEAQQIFLPNGKIDLHNFARCCFLYVLLFNLHFVSLCLYWRWLNWSFTLFQATSWLITVALLGRTSLFKRMTTS